MMTTKIKVLQSDPTHCEHKHRALVSEFTEFSVLARLTLMKIHSRRTMTWRSQIQTPSIFVLFCFLVVKRYLLGLVYKKDKIKKEHGRITKL